MTSLANLTGSGAGLLSDNMGLTRCPESSSDTLDYPSTTMLCSIFSVLAFVIAVVVVVRYNYLKWWLGGDIETPQGDWRVDVGDQRSVSNSYWIIFFVCCGVRGVLESIVFGANSLHNDKQSIASLQFAAWSMHAVTDFFLTLSLYHQYYYKSMIYPMPEEGDDGDLDQKKPSFVSFFLSPEFFFALLAMIHTVCAWFAVPNLPDGDLGYDDPYWILLGSIGLQRLPLYALLGVICMHPNQHVAAPTRASRFALFLGTVLDIPSVIPFHILSKYVLSAAISWKPCPLYFLSWLDLTILLHGVALCHFVYFIKSEFVRVHEIEFYDCLQHYSGNPIDDAE